MIIGSLSILGTTSAPPAEMVGSIDVDLFPRSDPDRIDAIAVRLGEGSAFHRRHGFYADPVSPQLASLPEDWVTRLVALRLGADVIAWCLEPNDAAVSKYVRCEERDRVWCRAGLRSQILSARTIGARFRRTYIVEAGEIERARRALDEDLRTLRRDRRKVSYARETLNNRSEFRICRGRGTVPELFQRIARVVPAKGV